MKKKAVFIIAATAMFLTACESRDDVFSRVNQSPSILISLSPDFPDSTSELDIKMRFGEKLNVYYRVNDENSGFKDGTPYCFRLQNETRELQLADASAVEYSDMVKSLVENQFWVDDPHNESYVCLHSSANPRERLATDIRYTFALTCEDVYKKKGEAIIRVTMSENRAPVVALSASQAYVDDFYAGENYTEGYGYLISAEASADPEGDEIVAYEYLFDEGDVTLTQERETYQDGLAAKGGTYITATALSSVYHVFQSTGDVRVYARAKDSEGLWSAWTALNITIP